jgi:hypothetical protein
MPLKDPIRRAEYTKNYYQKNKEYLVEHRKKYDKEHYQLNKELIKNRVKEYHQKQRLMTLFLLGGKCAHCGCDNLKALEINHKNGGGYKEYKLGGTTRLYSKILNGERKTDDLELLCRICNAHHKLTKLDKLPDNWEIKWHGS